MTHNIHHQPYGSLPGEHGFKAETLTPKVALSKGLRHLLNVIGSLGSSTWEQHLRFKFGNEIANQMIAEVHKAVYPL